MELCGFLTRNTLWAFSPEPSESPLADPLRVDRDSVRASRHSSTSRGEKG